MCGVVGIIGQEQIAQTLITGLERLEYRGYDSAGIYIQGGQHRALFKEVGRIAALKEVVDFDLPATVGIGHTRWATHGPATQANAHPHLSASGRFVLVHNGVIENYQELKDSYLKSYTFTSDTDTEVAVMLVEYFVLEEGLATQAAFTKALSLIEGSYAFGLIDTQEPNKLYAAKNKSPLLVGLGQGFQMLCSDAMAAIHLTSEFMEIKDKEMVILTAEQVVIMNNLGQVVERESFMAEIDDSDLEKGTHPFYMIKEIEEQPLVMRRLLAAYYDQTGKVQIEAALLDQLCQTDQIYIVACGTSYHAGWVGKTLIEKATKVPVQVLLASEFAYDLPLLSPKPLFIFLTQSGETADSRQALVKVNELGLPSLTITNVKGSTLSREATYTLLLHAGPEIAVASTKAYTAQIAVMAILADALSAQLGYTSEYDMVHELSVAAAAMESVIAEQATIEAWVKEYMLTNHNAFFIGRLLDYYVAMEAALKLKEITYIQTEAFAAGELKHGTIALIEEGTPVFAVISDAKVANHTRGNVAEVKARGAHAIVIASKELAQPDDFFVVPQVAQTLTPLITVVVGQLLAYYTALSRGLDVDKPRNLAKSVTVE